MDSKEVKLFLMGMACQLAGAVVGDLAKNLPNDPGIKDPSVQSANVMAVHLVEIYYPYLLAAWSSSGAADAFKDPAASPPGGAIPGVPSVARAAADAAAAAAKVLLPGVSP